MITDITISLLSRFLIVLAGLITSVITARTLGVVGRAEYFFLITVANLVVQFSNIGLPGSNTYLAAKNPEWTGRLIANSQVVGLLGGGLIAVIVTAVLLCVEQVTASQAALLMCLIVSLLNAQLTAGILIGRNLFRIYNSIQIAGTGLQILLFGLSAVFVFTSSTFILLSIISTLTIASLQSQALNRSEMQEKKWDATVMRSSLSYAWRAYVMTLLAFMINRGGAFLLSTRSDPEQLGYFSVAIQFFDVLAIIPATCAMVLFPKLSALSVEQSRRQTLAAASMVGVMMLACCLILALASDTLVESLFGKEFLGVVPVLYHLLPGAIALSMANIFSQHLASRGIPPANILAWLACSALFFVIGYRVTPAGGAAALALSLTVGYIFLMVLLGVLVALDKTQPNVSSC
jgi:O-antigen/teichoic acid export membrane protein